MSEAVTADVAVTNPLPLTVIFCNELVTGVVLTVDNVSAVEAFADPSKLRLPVASPVNESVRAVCSDDAVAALPVKLVPVIVPVTESPEDTETTCVASTDKTKSWPPGAIIELLEKLKFPRRGDVQPLPAVDHIFKELIDVSIHRSPSLMV